MNVATETETLTDSNGNPLIVGRWYATGRNDEATCGLTIGELFKYVGDGNFCDADQNDTAPFSGVCLMAFDRVEYWVAQT